jgi:putative ABC transport system ATP-binding protein
MTPEPLSHMITVTDLKFEYPGTEFQLRIPDLTIARQERVAVVGPSGCGKTTLLNLISGISLPAAGRVEVAGQLVSSLSDAQRRDFRIANIGMVFQQFELVEYLNVKQNVLLPFSINRSLDRKIATASRVAELAAEMGLTDKLNRLPHQLSQGEKQRVAVCRALITNPQLILADEPTGNLDPKNKQVILDLIFQQAAKHQQTVVVVTHDMSILDGMDRTIDFQQFRWENVSGEDGNGRSASPEAVA